MYEAYFGFTEAPFSIAPNPRYLYMSDQHREAMAHLLFGVREGGGFVQLTGEVGTGKTTLCRQLLSELPENVDVALILNPRINELELMQSVCDELRIEHPKKFSVKSLLSSLNEYLLHAHARGRNTVLIIDEAQNLSEGVLEQVRLLTNLETSQKKLLQIILIGQTELREKLRQRSLRQLSQRITARYHISPLDKGDMKDYLEHRLKQSGCERPVFTRAAASLVFRSSKGVPRLVNVISDRALLGAYSRGETKVSRKIVKAAVRQIEGVSRKKYSGLALWAMMLLFFASTSFVTLRFGWLPESLEHRIEQRLPDWFKSDWTGRLFEKGEPVLGQSADDLKQRFAWQEVLATALVPVASAARPEQKTEFSRDIGIRGGSPSFSPDLHQELVLLSYPFLDAKELRELLGHVDSQDVGRISGLRRLTEIWNLPPTIVFDCITVRELGLDCYRIENGWKQLTLMNRPALLELKSGNVSPSHVVLRKLIGDMVLLEVGSDIYRIPWDQLSQFWHDKAIVLWRPPPLSALPVGEYSSGEDILWLRRALNLEGINYGGAVLINLETSDFDTELLDALHAFQFRLGLEERDEAGVEELILLNSRLFYEFYPRLEQEK